jgi:hypothetical protein
MVNGLDVVEVGEASGGTRRLVQLILMFAARRSSIAFQTTTGRLVLGTKSDMLHSTGYLLKRVVLVQMKENTGLGRNQGTVVSPLVPFFAKKLSCRCELFGQ